MALLIILQNDVMEASKVGALHRGHRAFIDFLNCLAARGLPVPWSDNQDGNSEQRQKDLSADIRSSTVALQFR